MTRRHRGVNRRPVLPPEGVILFRGTSKQEWAEIAWDLAREMRGGDEANDSDVGRELQHRRGIVRRLAAKPVRA